MTPLHAGGAPAEAVTVPVITKNVLVDGKGSPEAVTEVRVGGGPPAPVLVDSGSSGLVVFANVAGPAVHTLKRKEAVTYATGPVVGTIMQGAVTIGPLRTPATTKFLAVPPTQLTSLTLALHGVQGVDGILGIAPSELGPALQQYSPLLQLPRPYRNELTLRLATNGPSSMVLGPQSPPPAAVTVSLQRERRPYPNGAPKFASEVRLCWRLNALAPRCVPTVLDTGTPIALISRAALPPRSAAATGLPGTKVELTTPTGHPVWRYVTTAQPPDALSVVPSGALQGLSVAGIGAYLGRTVTFDFAHGRIVFGRS